MPIYEYRCPTCGDFDVMQKITEKPLRKCPTCKAKVTKLVSSTAFQLKGTGWYVTDYANKGKPAAEKSGDGESGGGDKAASGDGGGKPAEPKAGKGGKGGKGKAEKASASQAA